MPNHLRFILSIVVALVGAVACYAEWRVGNPAMSWIMAGLTLCMVGAVWLFPEARRKE